MRTPGLALAACLAGCLSAAPAADANNGERIVGAWQAVKGAIQPGFIWSSPRTVSRR